MTDVQMLDSGTNIHGRKLTRNQVTALNRRARRLSKCRDWSARSCIGCYSGIVPSNQGSDFCARCIKAQRGIV